MPACAALDRDANGENNATRGRALMRTATMKLLAGLGLVALLGCVSIAHSQDAPFPRGNIEITVLFPAGSSADVTARLLADGMARQLGTNVLVVNRPGAGGALGYRYVAGQKA